MIQQIALIQVEDQDQNRYNQSVKNTIDQLAKIPFLNGSSLKDVSLTTGANTINHGLNRTLQGFWITNTNAAVVPYNSTPSTMNTILQFQLTVSANVTVDLWVF